MKEMLVVNFIKKVKMLFLSIYSKDYRFFLLSKFGKTHNVDDEEYLKKIYKVRMGKDLNLDNPKTFNEKLQWLKLYDRKPEYTTMVDKYEVKKYVANIIGEEYIIPTLGIWDNVEDIELDKLPNQFVLKCTHDSGSIVICKDKSKLDFEEAKKKLKKGLGRNLFWYAREWPYKDVKPRIIAEKYLSSDREDDLSDYKVLCFHGEPKIIEVHMGRFNGEHTQDCYDKLWNKTNIEQYDLPNSKELIPKPLFLEEMLRLSMLLSKDIIHIRVDWYYTNNKLYFGELTFYDGCGYNQFCGDADELLGSWIKLPIK